MSVRREVSGASDRGFDIIVVGGGVYGAMLLLEATRRGLRAVAVERDDFGGATSWNHLRILHGGLRYLQHGDLRRHRESVEERRRFLADFPDFARPLPCLMPLGWRGLRNPLSLRAAALADDWISRDRNRGVPDRLQLPRARVLTGQALARRLAGCGLSEPSAALLWHDAFVPCARRLLMELLHRACDAGALAWNYLEAVAPLASGGRLEGLAVRDRVSGAEVELRAPLVVNATGPSAGAVAARWDREHQAFGPRTLAWNLLLDVESDFDEGLAVAAPRRGAPTLFLVPWEGRLLAGTGHAGTDADTPAVGASELAQFLGDLAAAAPGLAIREERVLRVYSGFLPGVRAGDAALSHRPVVLDHGAHGGPHGLWSVSGVKFTTARRVADDTLRRALGRSAGRAASLAPLASPAPDAVARRLERGRFGPGWRADADPAGIAILREIIEDESVVHLDDLLLRRTSLGDDPRTARALAPVVAPWFGADEAARMLELGRLERALEGARGPLA